MNLSRIFATLCVLLCVCSGGAVTLERLTMDEMADYSTYIVRASVKDTRAAQHGPVIYTEYALAVAETLKGDVPESTIWLSLPGGVNGGSTQRFAGVPELRPGREYLLFLRLGKSGLVQLVGMSQGLFEMEKQGATATAARPAIDGVLLDRKSGFRVQDRGMRLSVRELRSSIEKRPNAGGTGR